MIVDERIIDAFQKAHEFADADVAFLFFQLGIEQPNPEQVLRAKSFRAQVWHVAAEAGFEAAHQQPRFAELEPTT